MKTCNFFKTLLLLTLMVVAGCSKDCDCDVVNCAQPAYVEAPTPDLDIVGHWQRINNIGPDEYLSEDVFFDTNTFYAYGDYNSIDQLSSVYFGNDVYGNYTISENHFYKWNETAVHDCPFVMPFPTNLEWIYNVILFNDTLRFDYREDLNWNPEIQPSGPAIYVRATRKK